MDDITVKLKNKKEFAAADILKLLLSFVVVAIHTKPLINVDSGIVQAIFKEVICFPVPLFFMCTGFFAFGRKNYFGESNEKQFHITKEQLLKYIKLYIIWTVAYLPVTIWDFVNSGVSLFTALKSIVFGLFLTGEHFYSYQLWYLLGVIYSLVLFLILSKLHCNLKIVGIVCSVLFVIGCVVDFLIDNFRSSFLTDFLLGTIGSGRLFTGAIYIFIGACLPRLKINRIVLVVTLLISEIIVCLIPDNINSIIRIIPISCFLLLVLTLQMTGNSKFFSFIRDTSAFVFYLHMYVFFLYTLIFKEFKYYGFDAFAVSASLSLLISIFISMIKLQIRPQKRIKKSFK